jgi:hypothetical protein
MQQDHDDRRAADLSNARWRKSHRSGAQGNCVEVAALGAELVGVRDSKAPDGPVLIFAGSRFDALVTAIKRGLD